MSTQQKSYKLNRDMFKNRKEHGFTLVEILVVISIIAVIGTVVATLIINATQSNQKFSASNMTQSELLDSVARVTTQVAISNQILIADSTKLRMKTNEDGIEYETTYFYWANDGDPNNIPPGVDKTKLPNQKAFLEYKINKATNNVVVTNLISNYVRESGAKPIFTYFTASDESIIVPVQDAQLSSIKRVAVYFAITPSGREAEMEISTSAVPRMAITSAGKGTGTAAPIPQSTVLSGTLPSGTRTANLQWISVAGATQYNLYRDGLLHTTHTPNTTTLADANLNWGQTYLYHAIVTGYAGQSATSNTVSLTVVPDKPKFVNKNTLAGLTTVNNGTPMAGTVDPLTGAKYSVARGLTNQLAWTPMSGATGYRVVDSAGAVVHNGPANITSVQLPTNYGDVKTYYVYAYNVGQNNSGGDSVRSDPITLISPPRAPVISTTAHDDTSVVADSSNTVNVTTAPANTKGYIYESGSTTGSANTSEFTRNTTTSANQRVDWGSTTWYGAIAYNDAGNSPESSTVVALQKPGPFAIADLTQTQRAVYTNKLEWDGTASSDSPGSVRADWGDSAGRSSYDIVIAVHDSLGGTVVTGTNSRSASLTNSYADTTTMTPGAIYRYDVTAKAPNGLTRDATRRYFQTAPDVPRNGEVWIVCKNLANGQHYNHIYSSDTRPLYGKADRTKQTQFSNNGGGSGLDVNLTPGGNSAQTNSDGYYHGYTSGFILQNELDARAIAWKASTLSHQIRAYGTYKAASQVHDDFYGCNSSSWVEPTDPCYGTATWFAGCGLGKGHPRWDAS